MCAWRYALQKKNWPRRDAPDTFAAGGRPAGSCGPEFMSSKRVFHLHLVSDATGETLNMVARAACAQYEDARPIEHVYALVRGPKQLERALGEIENAPGLVMFTMVNDQLRERLEKRCAEIQTPCISVLDPAMQALGKYLGKESSHKPGSQHIMDAEYFDRIAALNYTMSHDDGP